MECQLSTRYSCQCPNCVVGGATEKTTFSDEDSSFINFSSASSSNNSYPITMTTTISETETGVTFSDEITSTTTTSIMTCLDDDEQQQQQKQISIARDEKRRSKNKKWERKLRRLNFEERASKSYNSRFKNPRRHYEELGSEYYEIFDIEPPRALASRVIDATKIGLFYPKVSPVLRALYFRTKCPRGTNRSFFHPPGVADGDRMKEPFVHILNDHNDSHHGKFDDRGCEARAKKEKNHGRDKQKWLKKEEERRIKKNNNKLVVQDENDDDENDQESSEQEYDEEILGWIYCGNKNRQDRVKNRKSGKFSLFADDDYHYYF